VVTENCTGTWSEGVSHCKLIGMNLVTFDSYGEAQNFVKLVYKTNFIPWVGISDTKEEGTFETIFGLESVGLPWAGDNPDNFYGNDNCVHVTYESLDGFNDYDCDQKLNFACEEVEEIADETESEKFVRRTFSIFKSQSKFK
jgi:hypothetical protein